MNIGPSQSDLALLQSAYSGNATAADAAILAGANVNVFDAQGNTPLHYAAGRGYDTIVLSLL